MGKKENHEGETRESQGFIKNWEAKKTDALLVKLGLYFDFPLGCLVY